MSEMMSKRFKQMRYQAKFDGKYSPGQDELEDLFFTTVMHMKCPVCNRQMHWSGKDGMDGVITLQHDRERPQIRLICGACNSHHNHLPGDLFYMIPKGSKYCPKCKQVKKYDEFSRDSSQSMRLKSWCKQCSAIAFKSWKNNKSSSDIERSIQS